MIDTGENQIIKFVNGQSDYFSSQQTKDVGFRLRQLRLLKKAIKKYQPHLEEALFQDLHKSQEEAYITEISIVLSEIAFHIKHLEVWSKPQKVATPMKLFPSSSKILFEPLGVALIIAPWNYPFHLLFNPLVGSIAAGCCTVLKPSPDTPHVARVIETLIQEFFDPAYITVVQGGREANTILFDQKFDIIFFTGSSKVGRVVMQAAAKHLTKVVLELGGKSPCIVDTNANLKIAAKRIAWGKLVNAGQTCVAPDYLMAHTAIKDELLENIASEFKGMFGTDSKASPFYPRIVNDRAMQRLTGLLNEGRIHTGGDFDLQEKFIAPTIIDDVKPDFKIMQDEIFGPILPVMTFEKIDEAVNYIHSQEHPLALYYFGDKKQGDKILQQTTSGGACINDTLLHLGNEHLPFGGIGNSGMGAYHGYESFLAFSHKKAVVSSPSRIDLPFRYPPFKYFKFLKRII